MNRPEEVLLKMQMRLTKLTGAPHEQLAYRVSAHFRELDQRKGGRVSYREIVDALHKALEEPKL
jgi:hypothetical protein